MRQEHFPCSNTAAALVVAETSPRAGERGGGAAMGEESLLCQALDICSLAWAARRVRALLSDF